MRMVKDRLSNRDEIIQVSEYDFKMRLNNDSLKGRKVSFETICDPPKRKFGDPVHTHLFDLTTIDWESNGLPTLLAGKNIQTLQAIARAVHSISDKNIDGAWQMKAKPRLIDYLMEFAYDLGWTSAKPKETIRSHENSKSTKQSVSKKAGGRKRVKRPRKAKPSSKD